MPPLVVVIDNAERLGDPKAAAFLMDAATGLSRRLTILLAYGEHPDFTISAQLALIPTWRLPRVTGDEAVALFENLGVVIDANRRRRHDFYAHNVTVTLGCCCFAEPWWLLRNRQQSGANS